MRKILRLSTLALLFVLGMAAPTMATSALPTERSLGNKTAPITVIEYASFTCSHCADFYTHIMPEIEKNYVETGKVRFIYRDFPIDAYGLKAATLAHCMPQEQFYPFVKLLFKNYAVWIHAPKPLEKLVQFAQMAGLPAEKANNCIDDTTLMDSIVSERTEASEKYDVTSTPTFIINGGEEIIIGSQPYKEFVATFDKLLAKKK